jgi:hypothetical protein
MGRRGRCRCGTILHFQKTSRGYKKRCPACGAVVRLRRDGSSKAHKSPSAVVAVPSGPPPLPDADESADHPLPPLPELPPASDLSVLSDHESSAAPALAEMEVVKEPRPESLLRWVLFGLLAVVVIVGVATATLLWG